MKVVLVHWNFECGFCDSISPDLARLEDSFQRSNVQLVLLAYGDAKSNREQSAEYGLRCPILLMKDQETPDPFEQHGNTCSLLVRRGRASSHHSGKRFPLGPLVGPNSRQRAWPFRNTRTPQNQSTWPPWKARGNWTGGRNQESELRNGNQTLRWVRAACCRA